MLTDRYYCHYCGFEDYNLEVAYSRQVANGLLCFCPCCRKENFCEEVYYEVNN